jgi:hypothetical protein
VVSPFVEACPESGGVASSESAPLAFEPCGLRGSEAVPVSASQSFSVRQQERTEPLFRWAFEGCHVTRDIPSLIREGGFKIEEMDTAYLAPFPKSPSYCFWGVAHRELR